MDGDLEFCLLKFAEEQQLLYDNERQEQEQIYQNHLTEIKNEEQKILCERQMIIELFEKQLMSNKQKMDDSKTQLEFEIRRELQQHIDSVEENVKQTIHVKEKEFDLWIQEKQHEKSNMSDENELLKFKQTFETEKEYKMKQLKDFREEKFKKLQIERESLNDNAQEILKMIANSNNENNWLENVQKWCDEKFELEKLGKKLDIGDSIKRISSTILDANARKQELIAEFKQNIKKMFQDEEREFNKKIDDQIQRLNSEKFPALNPIIAAKAPQQSFLSSLISLVQKKPADPVTEVINNDPTETTALPAAAVVAAVAAAVTVRQELTTAQKPISVASLELAKRQHLEQLEKDYKEIISELEASDINCIPDKIHQWLKNQTDERFKRFEKYRQAYEEKQAQCLADNQAQILGLVCDFNQLAINSNSADEFKEKLKNEEKRVIEKHRELKLLRMKIAVPVIVLQVDDLKVHKLPICIRFNEDFDQWNKDADNNKLNLISSIRVQFNLPENAFEIIAVERGSLVVRANINPPHGQQVFQILTSSGIADIGGRDTISVTLGELNLRVEHERMNARYNRSYGNNPGDTYWVGALDRGGKPYFCPKGWRRFGIKVANTKEEFDRRWGTWHIAYHGTANKNACLVLATGLRVARGCHSDNPVVYLSPSINYCAHYRYAKPWRNPRKPGKYYQMIFQCRVNPQAVRRGQIVPETLMRPQQIRVDEHFRNNELEWIIYPTNNGVQYINDNIICYGMMIRVCDRDPYDLPESEWWQYTGEYPRNY